MESRGGLQKNLLGRRVLDALGSFWLLRTQEGENLKRGTNDEIEQKPGA